MVPVPTPAIEDPPGHKSDMDTRYNIAKRDLKGIRSIE